MVDNDNDLGGDDGDDDDGDDADDVNEGGGIYMVFEFMDHDLTGLSNSNQYGGGFPLRQIKCVRPVLIDALTFLLSRVCSSIKRPSLALVYASTV